MSYHTPGVILAWETAAAEASQADCRFIEPPHLVIGLFSVGSMLSPEMQESLQIPNEVVATVRAEWEGLAALLSGAGADSAAPGRAERVRLGQGTYDRGLRSRIRRSPASRAVFARAELLALQSGGGAMTLTHLLAALVEEQSGALALRQELGADVAALRRAAVIGRAKEGDAGAFGELRAEVEQKVHGYIRARTQNDDDADDVAQETWIKVWQRMPIYDSAKPFEAFAKYWAHIMLLRFYAARRARRRVEVLFSELAARFPQAEQEEETGKVIERLTAKRDRRAEDVLIDAEEGPLLDGVYEQLLCLTYGGDSPPHQLVAFGYCKLLDWKPRQIVAELSDRRLRDLAVRLEAAYVETSRVPEDRIRSCFSQLRENLDHMLEEVAEPMTLRTYPGLAGCIVGDTPLRSYYTGKPAVNISHWCHAVERRVLSDVRRNAEGPVSDWLQQQVRRPVARKARRRRKGERGDG